MSDDLAYEGCRQASSPRLRPNVQSRQRALVPQLGGLRLETSDAADYRELRLESLRLHPDAFSTAWESDAEKPASWWTARLETSTVFGGWTNGSPLVGIVRFTVEAHLEQER